MFTVWFSFGHKLQLNRPSQFCVVRQPNRTNVWRKQIGSDLFHFSGFVHTPIEEEEIKSAVMSLAEEKIPKLDRIIMAMYKKRGIMKVFSEFYENS